MKRKKYNYVTRDMIKKDCFEGLNFAEDNAVKFDDQNGAIKVLCYCETKELAKGIAEALNILDNLEYDGIKVLANK